jgi:competence protein ComEC
MGLQQRMLPTVFAPMLGTSVTLQGVIVGDPDVRETNQRIPVQIREGKEATTILVVAEKYPSFSYGDEVTVSGTLDAPQPFATDGGRMFAYDRFLAKDGIFSLIQRGHLERTGESSSFLVRAQRALYAGKHAFTHALEEALPEPHASLAEGLIAGGKQGLGTSLLDAFTVTGLLPIIVLSGYNVMIVAEAVLAGLSFLPKRFSLTLAGLSVALFILAAGGGSSALRAGLMAGLALFARSTGRTYDALRALAFVFVLMLLINPLLLVYDPGFQFSFAATLGLILASSLFELRLRKLKWKTLREVCTTTIAAQLFVLPLLLYQTGNLSLVALPANIFVLPFVPLTMLLSALAGLGTLVLPSLGIFFGLPAYVFLSYITNTAEFMSRIPFAHIIIPAFPFWLLVLPYGLIAWLTFSLRRTISSAKVTRE